MTEEFTKALCMREFTLYHVIEEIRLDKKGRRIPIEGTELPSFNDSAICYVKNGTATVTGQTATIFPEETLFYIPAGKKKTVRFDGPEGILGFLIIIRNCYPEHNKENHPLQVVGGIEAKVTTKYFWEITHLMASGDKLDSIRAVSAFYRLYAKILPFLQDSEEREIHPVVESAMRYIRRHCCENYTVAELSAACNISYSRLAHLFMEDVGMTPTEFRNKNRIEYAAKLLRTTDRPLKDIALECGYPSPPFFGKVFKEITGTSPALYREKKFVEYITKKHPL